MEQSSFIYVTAPFPAQLEYKARMEAARRRISRAEFVRLAVIDYLARLDKSAPTPSTKEAANATAPSNG